MQHISVGSSFSASASSLRRTYTLALTGVLIAMQLALSSVAVYVTADMRITFGFLTIAATATLFGPVVAGVHGALADILACFLFPAGAYFPGYTLTALLVGLLYGLFFYRREVRLWHVLVAQLVVDLLCHVLLNTLWRSMTGGSAMMALLPVRLLKNALCYPVNCALLYFLHRLLRRLPASLKR
ncbi:folate family ECF transporter S component [Beduinella massiliensis]|uniref:folate family ECF transporter S component n=1 Tax=Beduinella massiliensis TaxID=1852363 RepID=UPI0031F9B059